MNRTVKLRNRKVSKKYKALIVEDNPLNMSLINVMLKKLNIESLSVANGEEALEIANSIEVDYMLLDINLGYGISGITLMEKLRSLEKFSRTPIIAVTAYSYRELQEYFNNGGFTDYIGKPFKFDQLREKLKIYGLNPDLII